MEIQDKPRNRWWPRYVIIALLAEKVIQHVAVTMAFYFNWNDIGSTVAVSPAFLMVAGAALVVLFALALWAVSDGRVWATKLVIALALCDILGEFVAQGTVAIDINVSFIVATVLLVLAVLSRAKAPRTAQPS